MNLTGMVSSKVKTSRIKIISLGNSGVGKSCLIKRYCEKRFVSKYFPTIGVDYGVTKVPVKGKDVKVNIFDMSGLSVFYEIRNEFYKDTQGVLLVFDACDKQSFDNLSLWIEEIHSEMSSPEDIDNITIVVVANKVDRPVVVDLRDCRNWADLQGFQFFEVSATTGQGVSEAFQALFDMVVEVQENGGRPKSNQRKFSYSKEQVEAIAKLTNSKSDYERLGLTAEASKDDINKVYRKLAILLHPDKSVAPGSEEAFKLLVTARTNLLRTAR